MPKIYELLDIIYYQEVDSNEWTFEPNEMMGLPELFVQVICTWIRGINDNFEQMESTLIQLRKYEDLETVADKISELINHSDLIDQLIYILI